MSQQSPQKVLDRILNYPNKEKGCVYLCGPHLEPCDKFRADVFEKAEKDDPRL